MRSMLLIVTLLLAPAGASAGRVTGVVTADGGLSNPTIVYAEDPAAPATSSGRAKIVQKNVTFLPSALVVERGASVDFPNEDKIYHNVFSLTEGNEFDLGLYRGGVSKTAKFDSFGEVLVYCNIHPDMVAKVLVVPPGRYVNVASDGKFALDLPAGTWKVVAWSPDHEPVTVKVAVKSDAKQIFSLKRRKAVTNHLNKNGEQYGRYK